MAPVRFTTHLNAGSPAGRSMIAHAVRMGASANASSLDHIAPIASRAATRGRRLVNAHAAAADQQVTTSAVRPLIQSTAMLIPWKLRAHTIAAAVATPR